MTPRIAAFLAVSTAALLSGGAALAQAAPDFGDDTSAWANDGECDDPRFTGPGMAASTVDADLMHDATDCRAAFEAGTVQLAGGQPPAATTPPPKGGTAPAQTTPPAAATATAVNFGDDSSEWANDGECDDRRFTGQGMATSLSWTSVGRDATDCQGLYDAGSIRIWNPMEAQAATQCAAVDFGDDTGQYANDGECDDIRFEGLGAASGMGPEHVGHDAADCLQLCAYGSVALRDY